MAGAQIINICIEIYRFIQSLSIRRVGLSLLNKQKIMIKEKLLLDYRIINDTITIKELYNPITAFAWVYVEISLRREEKTRENKKLHEICWFIPIVLRTFDIKKII